MAISKMYEKGSLQKCQNIFSRQLGRQMVLFRQPGVVIAVIEGLGDAEIQYAYIRFAIIAGDLFSEATGQTAIFHGCNDSMIFPQLFQELCIEAGEMAGIDDRGVDTARLQFLCRLFCQAVEIAGTQESQ